MLLVENVQQQLQLLVRQRLTLIHNRYSGFAQLRQHDYRLLDCVQLASDCAADSTAPGWLNWLLAVEPSVLLKPEALSEFEQQSDIWLLLHELKSRRSPELQQTVLAQLQGESTAETDLYLRLAARLQLTFNPFDTPLASAPDATTPEVLFYVACSGQLLLLPALQAFTQQLSPDSPLLPCCHLAIYLLSDKARQKTDEAELVRALVATTQLNHQALMLLMAGASDTVQSRVINQLSNNSGTANMAIAAMGYSGQLKFVPLLLELAQADDSREVATDSLTVLLGSIEADSLLSAPQLVTDFQLPPAGARQLGGSHISSAQLAGIWQGGNTQQRQLVACYRSLATTGTPLSDACALTTA